MDYTPSHRPRTLTLKEVLEGAKRAEERIAQWPEWKRELSACSQRQENPAAGSPDSKPDWGAS